MQTCTLNGTWQLSAGHRSLESVDMQIPGTVLSGLLAAGKIKDPFYRTNEDATRALFWKDYVFTRTFDVDEELLAQQHIVLVCEGLDTLAEISINGTFLAKTDNMHRTWKFQAKKLLHPGKNEIQIVFRSVLRFIEDYPYEAHKKINYIPCGSMKGNQLLRKAHSMFGWDWGPQTIDAGIFRDIYLQGYSHARIEDIRIHQQHAKNVSVQTSITLSESVPGQKLCVELSEDGADNPDDANRGDTHYWDVWHGQKPFTDYRKYFFRFCSEFGFQSFPCAKTVNSFTLEDDRNIFSRVMESHQKNDAANGKMLYYLSENLRYPKDLTHLLYASQVLQGMAIKYGVDHWRRNRGRCMGTLYWQINDDWPAPSWSSIDYFGRWKALHYMAQKFYAPHAVSMTLEDHRCHVYFSNESFETTEYSLTLSIRDLSGNVLETYETKGNSPAFSAIETAVVDICSWEDQKDDVFLEAVIHTKDQKVLKDVETLVPYKYLNLKNPVISTEAEETNDAFILHISSDCFAPFVALDFDDADVIFSDNFFHLTDKTVQDIIVKKEDILQGHFENAEDFRKRLQILSLGTSYARS